MQSVEKREILALRRSPMGRPDTRRGSFSKSSKANTPTDEVSHCDRNIWPTYHTSLSGRAPAAAWLRRRCFS